MMSPDAEVNLAKAGFNPQPTWCAHVRPTTVAQEQVNDNLHFKGFVGGVPLNTERAAVKPRAGIE